MDVRHSNEAYRAELAAMGLVPPAEPDAVGGDEPGPAAPPRPGVPVLRAARPRPVDERGAFDRWVWAVRRALREPSVAADARRDRDLASGLRRQAAGAQRLVVLATERGAGQTTVAVLLAAVLARVRNDLVALVDLDPHGDGVSGRLPDAPASSADDILTWVRRRDSAAPPLTRGAGMPLVVTAVTADPVTGLAALRALERKAAVTVVDAGPLGMGPLDSTLLDGAAGLVVVAEPGAQASGDRVLGLCRDNGFVALADRGVVVRRGDGGAPAPHRHHMPEDPALRGVVDLRRASVETRTALTAIARAALG